MSLSLFCLSSKVISFFIVVFYDKLTIYTKNSCIVSFGYNQTKTFNSGSAFLRKKGLAKLNESHLFYFVRYFLRECIAFTEIFLYSILFIFT